MSENSAGAIYLAAATDPEGNAITFSIAGGPDVSRFNITTAGQLSFKTPPNYELPDDADKDNVYRVTLAASDGRASSVLDLAVTVTNDPEGVFVRRIATGFADPVDVSIVNASTLLVAERDGNVFAFDVPSGRKTLLIRIPDSLGSLELHAIAASKTYANDGSFYLLYSNPLTRIEKYARNSSGATALASFNPVLTVGEAFSSYRAERGWLHVADDGDLFAAMGDGRSLTMESEAQSGRLPFGKLFRLRLKPDPYAGAAVGPFYLSTQLAKGLLSPQGGALLADGRVLLTDRGNVWAEVNLVDPRQPPANLGWPYKDGSLLLKPSPPANLVDPILAYEANGDLSPDGQIVGGAVSAGPIISLRDRFLFADQRGAIFALPLAAIKLGQTLGLAAAERRTADFAPDQGVINGPRALKADANGIIYILDFDGDIFRVDAR
ncbi:PQQ-dependent sugar dehydrogenase [Allosphingosinicella indica]|uniref:Cadherin domain-containing protein n=1 Tax=Allosphingosinicella indica TaxID=941907 RepID=A0A1X7FYM5_9SPHN|nr:PQQ-dependent sugar dehydrogenase [Allosphingosinicella indica]SMF61234.1 hypothetical protein SAMN06295910_0218 [Allosphingosinicella indica]